MSDDYPDFQPLKDWEPTDELVGELQKRVEGLLNDRMALRKRVDELVEAYDAAADIIRKQSARIGKLEAALKPFADVARHDISADESNSDLFQPLSGKVANACLLTVGDMRHALSVWWEGKAS